MPRAARVLVRAATMAVCAGGLFAVSVAASVAPSMATSVVLGGPITELNAVGSQGFGDIGSTSITGPTDSISTASAFSFGSLLSTGMNSGRFTGMPLQNFGLVSFTVAAPASLQFGNEVFGRFVSTSILELSNVTGSRSFRIGGLFTAGTYGGPMQPNPTTAEFTISFNQNAGPGSAISSNGTLAIVPVPEPGTIALVAFAAVTALACHRRCRRHVLGHFVRGGESATSGPPRPDSGRGETPSRCR